MPSSRAVRCQIVGSGPVGYTAAVYAARALLAAGMGCMAALEADKYLANLEAAHAPAQKKVVNGNNPKP